MYEPRIPETAPNFKPSYFYLIVFSFNHCILLNFIPCNELWIINYESWVPRNREFCNVGLLCVFVLLFSRFNSRSIFTSFKLIQDLAYSRVLIFMICICESLSHISQNTKPKPPTPSSPPISGLILIQKLKLRLRWEIFSKNSSKSTKILSYSHDRS